MVAYYNEHDPFAAAWLRNLISEGLIAPGDVDERDIQDVRPDDVRGYEQCHFFAGIGGWSYAFRLAGWPDTRPVWTGSCPCQPYSSAGKGKGADDSRNLWPHWFRLISECRPPVVFGEQVEAAIRHGWLDAVSTDLEAEDYAFGAAVLGAHSAGAPHIRQRAFFVAHSQRGPTERHGSTLAGEAGGVQAATRERERFRDDAGHGSVSRTVADPVHARQDRSASPRTNHEREAVLEPERYGAAHWSRAVAIPCADGRSRLAEPGIFPLAARVPNRVGTLRGAGNAICPQTAAAFVGAYMYSL